MVWKERRSVPEVSAPLVYRDNAYTVVAGGKLFVASGEGIVTSLAVGHELKVQADNDLGEPACDTPALIGSQIYLRSDRHLRAFGPK